MSMLRTIKPKNARVKRALDKREPQEVEGEKTAIFVRGNSTSDRVRTAMKDMYALKRPAAINFSRKNDIHPFDSTSSLEFFSQKNDASSFVTGSHSKKRPHDSIFTRMFDGRVSDMVESGVEAVRSMSEFDSPKSAVGARPLMVFHSDSFDVHPTYQLIKSMLLDFYGGHAVSEIPPTAIEHIISITAGPMPSVPDGQTVPSPKIHLRVYTLKLLPSGTRAPRPELNEMGPSIDFSVRRSQEPDEEMLRQANKRPKIAKSDVESGLGKKKKNIETDAMGDRVGKIHSVKQDLDKMQGRKMKGLKVHKEKRAADAKAAKAAAGGEMDED